MSEKVALLDSINPAAKTVFEERGFEVIEFPKSLPTDGIAELASEVEILGIRSGPKLPREVIEAGETLQAIGCFCVGTDHVDKKAANERGIAVFNSLHENTRSVAEHVINNTFNLLRRTSEHNIALHDGTWTKTDEASFEVRGKTMGIVGYGAVGSQVSVLAEAVGMKVIYYDPAPKFPPYGQALRAPTLDILLGQADVLTLHVPGGKGTENLFNKETIERMKPHSYLINTSRGEVVDYEAVADAIASGHLGGIAADVFVDEPKNEGDEFSHLLQSEPKAILTPHVAGSTVEAQFEIGKQTAQKLIGYLTVGSTVNTVNMPELGLEPLTQGTSRLLHIHHNVPGVMANVNNLVTSNELNVVSERLQVKGDVGYAAVDVEGTISDDLLEEIRSAEPTIRVRVLSAG